MGNLVLPGIGGFFIVDSKVVTPDDIGNNFFFQSTDIGCSRAKVATQLLLELNSDVKGEYLELQPQHLLERDMSFFLRFSVVIASNLDETTLSTLACYLW